MVTQTLSNERVNIEMQRSVIIIVATIILATLFGCAHKGNVYSDDSAADRRNVYSDSALVNNHMNRTDRENATVTDGNSISICKDTTRHYLLRTLIKNVAKYEWQFNKKIPNCRMADDANSEYWPIVSDYCRECDLYLDYLIKRLFRNYGGKIGAVIYIIGYGTNKQYQPII